LQNAEMLHSTLIIQVGFKPFLRIKKRGN